MFLLSASTVSLVIYLTLYSGPLAGLLTLPVPVVILTFPFCDFPFPELVVSGGVMLGCPLVELPCDPISPCARICSLVGTRCLGASGCFLGISKVARIQSSV